ncbi:hypothetical protein BRD00_12090 [Halobacteriales archaeon QS_8_69_26]|nr:MAG: hypothetical protein BRD00_12090 [Halobacteriales archaeon QS_8_69_26]
MADPSTLLGPVDALAPYIEPLLVVLVVLNMVTRLLAHRRHRKQVEEGAEAVARFVPHELSNVVLVLGSFYFMTVEHHGGMVLSMLVVGMVITDFFEFESRKVEVREERPLDRPKAALVASLLVLSYALFQAVFYLVRPYWSSIV